VFELVELDSAGAVAGVVRLPHETVGIASVAADAVTALERDTRGVPSVVRYRLRRR
jgi:hypothetical protein